MAKKRLNQPKPLSEQFHNKALDARLNYVEGFVRLAVQDLNNITNQLNFLGSVLQAAVNVLGQGAVNAEMQRLAKGGTEPAPPSEEQKAALDAKIEDAVKAEIEAEIETDNGDQA